eukprot:scaffold1496_cov266-Ochromonas_danica.AAC.6
MILPANREKKKGVKGRRESVNPQKILAGLQVSTSSTSTSGRLLSFYGHRQHSSVPGSASPSPTNRIPVVMSKTTNGTNPQTLAQNTEKES